MDEHVESETTQRTRTLTDKGKEHFDTLKSEHLIKLDTVWNKVERSIKNIDTFKSQQTDITELRSEEKNIHKNYDEYRKLTENYNEFLTRSENTQEQKDHWAKINSDREKLIQGALTQIDQKIQEILELMSQRSSYKTKSKTSMKTNSEKSDSSSVLTRKKAKAEAARMKVEFAFKEHELKTLAAESDLKGATLAADLELLQCQKEAATFEAEVRVLQSANSRDNVSIKDSLNEDICLPCDNSVERTKQYILKHSTPTIVKTQLVGNNQAQPNPLPEELSAPLTENRHIEPALLNPYAMPFTPHTETCKQEETSMTSEFTRFLLKKDLLFTRLSSFNDRPEFYELWKATFKSVMTELHVTNNEEMDLLIKWLGPESSRHALSIRTSTIHNPQQGLQRIWARLNEIYGCPEMVELSLKTKLENFPKIGNKDFKKLYDLADIVSEIETLKENETYKSLLGYFDSSTGVIPIVRKLPYSLQEKWTNAAVDYKKRNNVVFPPFWFFARFLRDISRIKNDPSFSYDLPLPVVKKERATTLGTDSRRLVSTRKTEVQERKEPSKAIDNNPNKYCPLHRTMHALKDCRGFKSKPIPERYKLLREFGICFKCCVSTEHMAKDCNATIKCVHCGSEDHPTALHVYKHSPKGNDLATSTYYGGEPTKSNFETPVSTKCTQVCGKGFIGKSCAKTILVNIFSKANPQLKKKVYVIMDDQSNASLASSDLFDLFDIDGESFMYTLSSCSGTKQTFGRKADGFVVEAIDGSFQLDLPLLTECNEIPNIREEIPTPEVVEHHPHLHTIKQYIPPLEDTADILVLIGRDSPEAHHVKDQLTGPRGSPFAQKLSLGWVIVGQVCLGQIHRPEIISVNKTNILSNGRPSICMPCTNEFNIKNNTDFNKYVVSSIPKESEDLGFKVLEVTKDDNKPGLSVEDREFLQTMDTNFKKNEYGKWEAPLPFRQNRRILPSNRQQALNRALNLDRNLRHNPVKKQHFVTFMDNIFKQGHAELADQADGEEVYYLPIFGVYHPKKPDQIRGVFDSSAQSDGVSLNKVLLSGPDLINSLLGILLRFRKHPVAIMADIRQMFYCFSVRNDHRRYLKFFWYKDNNPDNKLVEYQICVHVFGNSPSPAVATYGLRRTAEISEEEYGSDMRHFVDNNFYVDDGLTSLPTDAEAIDFLKRTQQALWKNGQLQLHKIVSNSPGVMAAFDPDDRAKDLKELDLSTDTLPVQRTLGLAWNLESDTFTFKVNCDKKPFTKRGVLSTTNSLYDPLGFIAPVILQGKIFLRNIIAESVNWDDPLPIETEDQWQSWKESLKEVETLNITRTYIGPSFNNVVTSELHVYSDASEQAIAAVAYILTTDKDGHKKVGFVLGKAKVAPLHGHTVPRLELCAATLAVDLYDVIKEHLDVKIDATHFYTDSKVILGYIHNESKRFHTYVCNRVQRIRRSSTPAQWSYVHTSKNPADLATRPLAATEIHDSTWLLGPVHLLQKTDDLEEHYSLINPDDDKEIRLDVTSLSTKVGPCRPIISTRFARFSRWNVLVRTIAHLKHIAACCSKKFSCLGWHICDISRSVDLFQQAKLVVIRTVQREFYSNELQCLRDSKPLSKSSSLLKLNPILDIDGILRVGGRIKRSEIPDIEKTPILIPGHHHIAYLLIRHHHEIVKHQGRHITEGSIRAAGFWIVGGKRLISSVLHVCVICRKLRGKQEVQKMSDLPHQRLKPAPPFTYVGVDAFGPWSIVTRRTRGGVATSKRWAIIFTCLTTRAIHIEVIEDMGTNGFVNALRRFIAIRGKVKEFFSDQGTNFVGTVNCLSIKSNLDQDSTKTFMYDNEVVWHFNPPHSSHMGGVWERMIGVVRRILDSMLMDISMKNLTHEVLCTLMAEVCSIVNSRPLVPVSSDSENPTILSPSTLLTQKTDHAVEPLKDVNITDLYKSQWKCVQILADTFWRRWRTEYLQTLQTRRKWQHSYPDLQLNDVVLLRDKEQHRNDWSTGIIQKIFPSDDGHVRKVLVRVIRNGKPVEYLRPVTETVLLYSPNENKKSL